MVQLSMKRCSKCKQEYPISLFGKRKSAKDGLDSWCKACSKTNFSNWKAVNPERDRQRKADYAKRNPGKEAARKAKWSHNNLDKRAQSYAKRRAMLASCKTYVVSDKDLKRIFRSPCFYCGKTGKITLDHIIPISKGGSHGVGNLVGACNSCNSSKCDKYLFAWRMSKAN